MKLLTSLTTIAEIPFLDPFTDWLGKFLVHNGIYTPAFLLLLDEAGLPLPIPGDVYIAYTGYLVKKGALTYPEAFLFLSCAVLLGSSILYALSDRYGRVLVKKFGPFFHLDEEKLRTAQKYFRKYGILAIIIGRHVPGFRVPITVFAGISDVTYTTFIISTFISTIPWIIFYLSLGEKIGPKLPQLLHHSPLSLSLFLIPFILFLLVLLFMRVKDNKKIKEVLSK